MDIFDEEFRLSLVQIKSPQKTLSYYKAAVATCHYEKLIRDRISFFSSTFGPAQDVYERA